MAQVRNVLCPHCSALLDARSGFDYVTVAPDIHVIACHFGRKALGPYALDAVGGDDRRDGESARRARRDSEPF
jgi:hypothetical protein